MESLDHARGEDVGVEVPLETLLDAGPQHLDGDRLERAVRHPHLGLMHLRDRGGGDGGAELGIERVDGRTQRLLDRRARLGLRERRQAVLQRGEIAGQLAADDVVARREKLAELDVGGPERGQRVGELRLVRALGSAVLAERRGDAGEQRKRRRQVRIVGQDARARPGQHGAGLGQPSHIGDRVTSTASS